MESFPKDQESIQMVTVTVLRRDGQLKERFQMRSGMNLWVFLRKNEIPIGASCSGVGVCAACQIKIIDENQDNVSPKTDFEQNTLARNGKSTPQRLACLCRVYQDITVQSDVW